MKLTRRALLMTSVTVLVKAEAASVARVTTESEAGEQLIVTGRIVRSDANTPASGVTLTLYQTDAAGIYGKSSGIPAQIARLRGKLVTGADGR